MPQKLKEMFQHIKSQQNTVDILLKEGILGSGNNPELCDVFQKDMIGILTILYQEDDCSIGFVDYQKEVDKDRETVPLHLHHHSIQYITVVKGSVLLKLSNTHEISRVMKTGECASIPVGVNHKTLPLEENTKIFFICIPEDSKFKSYLGRD
jgi:mannose-6-phosphate isomerase-like protein (cupin superfamily)